MIDAASHEQLSEAVSACIKADRGVLESLREEIRPLKAITRRIQPRSTTAISLVGTDGGTTKFALTHF